MPTISDSAVCIRRWDFSETSQTVSLLTREHGIIRGLAKGAKREKGAFSGGLDVLTRGQVVAIVRPGRELATLTEWHLDETYRVIRRRLDANRAGLYMADLVHHMLTDQDPHPPVFDALVEALDGLADPSQVGMALLLFQWRVLAETGYRPEVERDAETGRPLPEDAEVLAFNPRAGGIVAAPVGSDHWRVRRSTVELLRTVASGSPAVPIEPEAVRRANRLLAVYCRELIGSELPTMRWAFSDRGAGSGGGGPAG
jgi:DNA repair protein RecO (recombination protein O)